MPQHGRLLLDAAAVGDHDRRAAHERQELQVAERLHDQDARDVQQPGRLERGPAARDGAAARPAAGRRAPAARPRAAAAASGVSTFAGRWSVATA